MLICWEKSWILNSIDSSVKLTSSSHIKNAVEILGFIATLPYDGADPNKARQWVYDTLPQLQGQGDIREMEINGVKFTIYGIPTFYTLLIEVNLRE